MHRPPITIAIAIAQPECLSDLRNFIIETLILEPLNELRRACEDITLNVTHYHHLHIIQSLDILLSFFPELDRSKALTHLDAKDRERKFNKFISNSTHPNDDKFKKFRTVIAELEKRIVLTQYNPQEKDTVTALNNYLIIVKYIERLYILITRRYTYSTDEKPARVLKANLDLSLDKATNRGLEQFYQRIAQIVTYFGYNPKTLLGFEALEV